MSDPKLKEAMAEIFGILKKHDIGGQVTLVSPTHAEFRSKIDPSWSVAFFEDHEKGVAVRFRATKAEIPDKEERHQKSELTTHLLCQIRDLCGQNFLMFDGVLNQLKEHLDFDHTPQAGYEPHREG